MTPWQARARFPLYLRLWLAVVASVIVLTVAFGWLWHRSSAQVPEREVIIRNEAGDVIGQEKARPQRDPVRGVEFNVEMKDGSRLILQFPPRPRIPGEGPPPGRGPGRCPHRDRD